MTSGGGQVGVQTSPGGICALAAVGMISCCTGLTRGQTVNVLSGGPKLSTPCCTTAPCSFVMNTSEYIKANE